VAAGEAVLLRHDADDGRLLAAEAHGASHDPRVAAEPSRPYLVAEHDHGRRVGARVGLDEGSPEERRGPRDAEGRRADLRHRDGLGGAVGADDQVAFHRPERAEIPDGGQLLAPHQEVVEGAELRPRRPDVLVADAHDPVAVLEGQIGTGEVVDDLQVPGPEGDAQGHREDADRGEPRIAEQHAQPEPHVQPRHAGVRTPPPRPAQREGRSRGVPQVPTSRPRRRHSLPLDVVRVELVEIVEDEAGLRPPDEA
jgi:hypothetical protein